ncbi:MAG: PrgI family protein [bacterium]|nr:PrgI family protein [bacterium]
MQFQVPQFIETEDKVVGPLSLRQFAYIGIAVGISSLLLFLVEFWFWIILSLPILGVGGVMAFGRVNGRPISIYVKSLFQSIWAPSVYVFHPKGARPEELPKVVQPKEAPKSVREIPKPDFQGIKNLWEKINTSKTAIPKREKALPAQSQSFSQFKEKFEAVRQITGEREVAKRIDYR